MPSRGDVTSRSPPIASTDIGERLRDFSPGGGRRPESTLRSLSLACPQGRPSTRVTSLTPLALAVPLVRTVSVAFITSVVLFPVAVLAV